MSNDVTSTLQERGSRYGTFVGHAKVTQRLKKVVTEALDARGTALADDQQEAIDMILHKLGRIINGDPDYDDSWRDIAGYSMLVCKRLNGEIV